MSYTEKVLAFNKQMKEALSTMYNALNHGQQIQILKNDDVKQLLIKYGVIEE